MTTDQFKSVDALVFKPARVKRTEVHNCLRVLGIGNVIKAGTVEELTEHLRSNSPDLLLCVSDYADEDSINLVRSVRDGAVTKNPFLTVLAMTWCSDDEHVAAFRDAGVDGFLSLPVSPAMVEEFLQTQIMQRKKFVASTDYIGPDRRRGPARSGTECFGVVNSLRLKVLGSGHIDVKSQFEAATRESVMQLNAASQRSHVMQLCVQWRLLERCRAGSPDFMIILKRLCGTALKIKMRAHRAAAGTNQNCSQTIIDATAAMKAIASFPTEAESVLGAGFGKSIERLGQAVFSLAEQIAPECVLPRSSPELDAIATKIDIRRGRRIASGQMMSLVS